MTDLVGVASSVPCPSWCAGPDGHPYEPTTVPDELLTRVHHAEQGGGRVTVQVEILERAMESSGPALLMTEDREILILVDGGCRVEGLTAAEARDVATALMAAADLADALGPRS